MSTIKIEPGSLGAFIRKSSVAMNAAVQRGVYIAKLRAVAHLKMQTPVDTGVMKNAWAATKAGVENSAPYAGIIERGARPHKMGRAGIDAIRDWVTRKGFATTPKGPGRGKQGPVQMRKITNRMYFNGAAGGKVRAAVDSIVWAIVKKIEKKGYTGRFFVRESMPELISYLNQELTEQLRRAAEGKGAE